MNHRILEAIWNPLSKTKFGRFAAGAIIGGLIALFTAAQQLQTLLGVAVGTLAGAVMGILAVALLTAIDSERAKGARSNRDFRQGRPLAIRPPGRRSVPPPIPTRQQESPPQ